MKKSLTITVVLAILILIAAGCDRAIAPSGTSEPSIDNEVAELQKAARHLVPPVIPSPLVTVAFGDQSKTFWLYTAEDFTGEASDPVNLVFIGQADSRDIRAALLSLDGDRTAFGMPPVAPFNCLWDDAIGNVQVTYNEPDGWTAGSIQLECGDHLQVRFHLRLFDIGGWTVGNCHFEFLVPGTSEHQVLSWELAEQLVVVDLIRSGLLDPDVPMFPTGEINETPCWRTIPPYIYNELPVELRQMIGGPIGNVTTDVPLYTDGVATVLSLAGTVNRVPESRTQDFYINFGQVIPKPFCSSGQGDYVYVEGPVHLVQTTELTESGKYLAHFNAVGELSVTPVNPETGDPIGETMTAHVIERHQSYFDDYGHSGISMLYQKLLPASDSNAGSLFAYLRADSRDDYLYYANIECPSGVNESAAKPAVDLLTAGAKESD